MSIDPTTDWNKGYFVTPISKFINNACFYDYYITHDRASEGYKDARYDYDNVDENFNNFFITVPAKSGDLYFTVESYPLNSVPPTCTTGSYSYTLSNGQTATAVSTKPLLYFALYDASDSTTVIDYKYYIEQYQRPIKIDEANYSAGKVFKLAIKMLWFGSPHPDYTVKVYSKQTLEVKND